MVIEIAKIFRVVCQSKTLIIRAFNLFGKQNRRQLLKPGKEPPNKSRRSHLITDYNNIKHLEKRLSGYESKINILA